MKHGISGTMAGGGYALVLILEAGAILAAQDCNTNGIPDAEEIINRRSFDCDGNGVPDLCDLNPPRQAFE